MNISNPLSILLLCSGGDAKPCAREHLCGTHKGQILSILDDEGQAPAAERWMEIGFCGLGGFRRINHQFDPPTWIN
jgi:hypothetical protein